MRDKIPVALVGFGSQGRRVAQAVACQEDMRVIGVALSQPDLSAHLAFRIGYPIYCVEPKSTMAFKNSGISSEGLIDSLISEAKVVVDCTPSGVGKQNIERFYQKSTARVIFQAGEEQTIANVPAFFATTDFEKARKTKFVRMASPLAVSIARTILAVGKQFGLKKVGCTFIRAGSETMRALQGPVDAIVPEPASNLERVEWELNQMLNDVFVSLCSVKVSSILLDVQSIFTELTRKVTADAVTKLLTKTPRIVVVDMENGLSSTDSLFEFFRRIRPFSADVYEVCLWRNQIDAQNGMLKLVQAMDPHSVHIPEVIDAIRALVTEISKDESMERTDKALGILKKAF